MYETVKGAAAPPHERAADPADPATVEADLDELIHVVAERIEDLSERLCALRPAGAGLAPGAERGGEANHFPARSFR